MQQPEARPAIRYPIVLLEPLCQRRRRTKAEADKSRECWTRRALRAVPSALAFAHRRSNREQEMRRWLLLSKQDTRLEWLAPLKCRAEKITSQPQKARPRSSMPRSSFACA